jgi:hypothetical protein
MITAFDGRLWARSRSTFSMVASSSTAGDRPATSGEGAGQSAHRDTAAT